MKLLLPAVELVNDPDWEDAGWCATTFRWHPTSEAPPVLGLVFADGEKGRAVFARWVRQYQNQDELDEIRVSVIEGEIPGQQPGYTIHICPDPEGVLVRATAEGIVAGELAFAGKFNRMHPLPESPPMLGRFKEEYARHKEFLLAPVTQRRDGQLSSMSTLESSSG